MTRAYLTAGVAVTLVFTGASCSGDDETSDSAPESSDAATTSAPATSSTVVSSTVSSTEDVADTTPAETTGSTTTTLTITTTPPRGTTAATPPPTADGTTVTVDVAPTTPPVPSTTDPFVVRWIAPSGDYTASYPAEPMTFELPPPVETADAPVILYAVETADYGVLTSRTDYADYGLDASAIDIDGARDAAIDGAAGELTDSRSVTVQGREGLRFTFVVGDPQSGVGDGMLLLDGTVLYQVLGIGVVAEAAFLTTFVDSFAFTEET